MSQYINYFFRTVTDEYGTKPLSPLHIICLIIAMSGVIFLIKQRKNLQENTKFAKIIKIILTFGISLVVLSLYTWYIVTGFSGISESLPLYHCRTTMILCVLYTFRKLNIAKIMIIYWGIMGGILALLVPSTDPFIFPHFTFFTFFVGHIFMMWYVILILITEKYKFNKKDLKTIILVTLIYNLILVLVNYILNGNYGFLTEAPIITDSFTQLGKIEYILLILSLYTVVLTLIYTISSKIQHICKTKKKSFVLGIFK
ncbi:MAG: TMEM164-related integral membrane acyltransferase [Clostridium sp.]